MSSGKKILKIAPWGLAVMFFTACGNDHHNREVKHAINTASLPLIRALETNATALHRENKASFTVTRGYQEIRSEKMTKQAKWIIAPEVWGSTKPRLQQ